MTRTWSTGRVEIRPVKRRIAPLLILATVMAGCNGPAPSPVKEGRTAFSYDDDEIDPDNLGPRKAQVKVRGRR